jgi:hypothetical protein
LTQNCTGNENNLAGAGPPQRISCTGLFSVIGKLHVTYNQHGL